MAIKIIDTRKIKDEYVRANLHREARIMASLRHPNIIRLYETLKVRDKQTSRLHSAHYTPSVKSRNSIMKSYRRRFKFGEPVTAVGRKMYRFPVVM